MDLLIVPCTREKIWDSQPNAGPVAAKYAYTGRAFSTWRSHAEQSGHDWMILSTRYGLLQPDTAISPYNVPISSAVRDTRLINQLKGQGDELRSKGYDRFVLLDWERFLPLVQAAAGPTPVEVRVLAYRS